MILDYAFMDGVFDHHKYDKGLEWTESELQNVWMYGTHKVGWGFDQGEYRFLNLCKGYDFENGIVELISSPETTTWGKEYWLIHHADSPLSNGFNKAWNSVDPLPEYDDVDWSAIC